MKTEPDGFKGTPGKWTMCKYGWKGYEIESGVAVDSYDLGLHLRVCVSANPDLNRGTQSYEMNASDGTLIAQSKRMAIALQMILDARGLESPESKNRFDAMARQEEAYQFAQEVLDAALGVKK